jgi:hypothetical protein
MVTWIYAIATFVSWKYAITKTQVGNMPLQLSHTFIYAILLPKRIKVQMIHVFQCVFQNCPYYSRIRKPKFGLHF